ncbi:50S ribosomal subunit protein L3 [Alphaproteobacteria bacterium]
MEAVKRTGIVATKLGMTQVFCEGSKLVPVTLLRIERNVVIYTKNKDKHGYFAVVLGYGARKKMTKPLKGIASGAGIDSFRLSREFRVSGECALQVGSVLEASHFMKGQHIDVTAVSIGKGFAGGMKRYGFAGLEASHGVSLGHRALGSTGQRQDPGKVFKGKKMAGHMGHKTVTTQNLEIVDINLELSIVAVKGSIPGSKGGVVFVRDAVKRTLPLGVPLTASLSMKEVYVGA